MAVILSNPGPVRAGRTQYDVTAYTCHPERASEVSESKDLLPIGEVFAA